MQYPTVDLGSEVPFDVRFPINSQQRQFHLIPFFDPHQNPAANSKWFELSARKSAILHKTVASPNPHDGIGASDQTFRFTISLFDRKEIRSLR